MVISFAIRWANRTTSSPQYNFHTNGFWDTLFLSIEKCCWKLFHFIANSRTNYRSIDRSCGVSCSTQYKTNKKIQVNFIRKYIKKHNLIIYLVWKFQVFSNTRAKVCLFLSFLFVCLCVLWKVSQLPILFPIRMLSSGDVDIIKIIWFQSNEILTVCPIVQCQCGWIYRLSNTHFYLIIKLQCLCTYTCYFVFHFIFY